MKGYFITGTDTDVGKTVVTAGLVAAFNKRGTPAVALKPIATGSDDGKKGVSPDTEFLMKHAAVALSKEEVTVYSYGPPVSPHIAAAHADERIDLDKVVNSIKKTAKKADLVVVEGVGGWLVPLNESETVADLAVALQLPVIVVVSIKLGCINHAALTMDAIRARGLKIAGWVANLRSMDTHHVPDMINTLVQHAADAPMLGIVPPLRTVTPTNAVRHLNIDLLD